MYRLHLLLRHLFFFLPFSCAVRMLVTNFTPNENTINLMLLNMTYNFIYQLRVRCQELKTLLSWEL